MKILDFGLARAADDDSHLTQTGAIMGTPAYMAPEQARGENVDHRCDLFSLGCVIYRLCTGIMPFKGKDTISTLMAVATEMPKTPNELNHDVPLDVSDFVMRLLAKEKTERPASAQEVMAQLQEIEEAQKASHSTPSNQSALQMRDTIAFEPPHLLQAIPKNWRWLLVGTLVGAVSLLVLIVTLILAFKGSADKPGKEKDLFAQQEEETSKVHPKKPSKDFTNSLGMKFTWIPPGTFLMGSPGNEVERDNDEIPHKVTLTKGFYMGVHLVTQEQWQTIMGSNPSKFKGEKKLPVEMVSWEDCQDFIKKLRENDKKPYRLPTEAEWEFSCRAGTTTPFHFGQTIFTDQANYDGNQTYGKLKKGVFRQKTTPVGSFPANALGLYDMHGNVWEWCQDWLDDYPHDDATDPQGPATGRERVMRGGSWNNHPASCRSAYRARDEPDARDNDVGFRLCYFPD